MDIVTDQRHLDLFAEHDYDSRLNVDGVLLHGGFVGGLYHPPRSLNRSACVRLWTNANLAHYRALSHVPREITQNSWLVHECQDTRALCAVISARLLGMQRGERSGRHIANIDPSPVQTMNPPPTSALSALSALFSAHALDEAGQSGNEGHVLFVKVLLDRLWNDKADTIFASYWGSVSFTRQPASCIPDVPPEITGLTLLLARLMWREAGAVYSLIHLSDLVKRFIPMPDAIVTVLRCMAKDEMLHVRYLRVVLAALATLFGDSVAGNPIIDLAYLAAREIVSESVQSAQTFSSVLNQYLYSTA